MSLLSHVLGGMGSAFMPVNGFVLSRRVPVVYQMQPTWIVFRNVDALKVESWKERSTEFSLEQTYGNM